MSKKENIIKRMLNKHQARKDAEFEYKASLTVEERHAYEKDSRHRKVKTVIFCATIAGGAYILGRIRRDGNAAIEEIGVDNLDEALGETVSNSIDIAKDVSEFIEKSDVSNTETVENIVKEAF